MVGRLEPPRFPRGHSRGGIIRLLRSSGLRLATACVAGAAAVLLVSLFIVSAPGSVSVDQAGPNVLLVVADDMRPDSLDAMPTVRELAGRGVTFTHSFVTTPVCCPSRASIMTGLYARHHGVLTNGPPLGGAERFDDRSTVATWLQATGVRTGLVGRYLNGYTSLAVPPGWDTWFAIWQSDDGDEGTITTTR